eukprot:2408567-Prymnesium_polylepis.1
MFWDRNLPFAVEAFFFAAAPASVKASMRRTHHAFLRHYGLTAADVPLLEYSCSQQSPPANRESLAHTCWRDVS